MPTAPTTSSTRGALEFPGIRDGYAVCAGPAGPCTRALPGPLLGSYGGVAGPGAGTVVADAAGRWWFAYAAWSAGCTSYTCGGARQLFVAPMGVSPGSGNDLGPLTQFAVDHANGRPWSAYDRTSMAGGLYVQGHPSAFVSTTTGLVHVLSRAGSAHLIEYVDDGAGGRTWNAYDLTVGAGAGSGVSSDPSAFYDPQDGRIHVYVEAASGDLTEYVNDDVNGHPWNAYDLSYGASGGAPVPGSPSAFYDPPTASSTSTPRSATAASSNTTTAGWAGIPWNAWGPSVGAVVAGRRRIRPPAFYDPRTASSTSTSPGRQRGSRRVRQRTPLGRPWNAWDLSYGALGGGDITGTPSPFYDPSDGLIHVYARTRRRPGRIRQRQPRRAPVERLGPDSPPGARRQPQRPAAALLRHRRWPDPRLPAHRNGDLVEYDNGY